MGEISPGEFSQIVRDAIETHGVRLLVIDTLTGYTSAVSEQSSTIIEIHQLLAFAASRNVLTIMTVAEHGLIGTATPEPHAISLLSDTVILIRFFEAYGQIRRAISVFKKRYSRHEKTIRELRLTLEGIKVGRPLENFEGVLTGVPRFAGSREELIASKEA